MDTPFMQKLNEAQLNAATCKSNAVQILAGPGSGKTRVLTSRVAWLILSENVPPQNIVVVTFTNKAAKEMRHRLESPELLGPSASDKLCMGTFHSICARLLRQYHDHVNLKKNFTIADTDASKHAIKKLKEELKRELSNYGSSHMKPEAYYNAISKARNAGMNVDEYVEKHRNDWDKKDICIMFQAYEDRMHADNMVDFDNLLLYTRVLLQRVPSAANFVKHVLVDEFQDTNCVQYDIVKGLTNRGKALTIVGDPDQSIFGWRNADRENFIKMQHDYKSTQVCNLEENYRSTKSIIKSSFHVIEKDRKRIKKNLFTGNAEGVPISMLRMGDGTMEAQSVAEEIKRIIEYSGGLITYKDIAILVRMNYLSRPFETSLNGLNIPYVVIGGVKFFDRAEVKDIIGYLRFFYNTNDTEAFERIINRPKRGVGEVTMNKIEAETRRSKTDIITIIRDMTSGKAKSLASIPTKTKQNLREFVNLYDSVRTMIDNNHYIYKIFAHIIKDTNYKEFLEKEHPDKDGESRWGNLGELVTFAKQFGSPPDDRLAKASASVIMHGIDVIENDEEQQRGRQGEIPDSQELRNELEERLYDLPNHTLVEDSEIDSDNPDDRLDAGDQIVRFLELTTLSNNSKEEDEADMGRVTISTMHSAKGLEWPVVFTVACEEGVIPHARAEDMMEESRLLYVAMTRAKTFLYCTFTKERESWGKTVATHHSSFLKDMPKELTVKCTPQWNKETLAWVADVLHLNFPENFKKEHKGNKIWVEDGERRWSKNSQYGGDYNGYGRSTWSKMSKPYTFPAINSTPKPKPTAKSVASQPYATFGSAAAVKREDVIATINKSTTTAITTTKSATAIGSKRKRPSYGANTSHIQKK